MRHKSIALGANIQTYIDKLKKKFNKVSGAKIEKKKKKKKKKLQL
jgi:hypothetical protein